MIFWLGVLCGLWIGAIVGLLIGGLMAAAKRRDEQPLPPRTPTLRGDHKLRRRAG